MLSKAYFSENLMLYGNVGKTKAALLLARIAMILKSCTRLSSVPKEVIEFIDKETAKLPPRHKSNARDIIEAMKCIALKKSIPKFVKRKNVDAANRINNWVDASR